MFNYMICIRISPPSFFFVTISNNMEQQPAKMLFMLKGTYVVLWNTVHWLATSVHSIQSPRQGTAKHWSFPQEITMLHSCKSTMSWWDTYDSDILNQIAKRFSCKVCLIQESLSSLDVNWPRMIPYWQGSGTANCGWRKKWHGRRQAII